MGETSKTVGEDLTDPSTSITQKCWQSSSHSNISSWRYSLALYFFYATTHVVSYLRKEVGTRSRDLCLLSLEILQICQAWQTHLLVRHIPSRINVIADSLSPSRPLSMEWQFNPRLFKQIFDLLPTLSIDLFATRCNAPTSPVSFPLP